MPVSLTFRLDTSAATAALRKARQDLAGSFPPGPLREAMTEAGRIHLRFVHANYVRGSRGGAGWKPLDPDTVKQKQPNPGILRRTDTLLESLVPGDPNNILVPLPKGIRTGSRVSYGKYHNAQTGRPWWIPADGPTRRLMQIVIAKGLGLQARLWAKVKTIARTSVR